jgi:glycosyltransferase involved in cell wall biosynthesis
MRILMVAPQPFFRPRGTPFSVLHRIRALIRLGHQVDLVTYPFGDSPAVPGLTVHRCSRPFGVSDVAIGPSWAKLLLDLRLFRLAQHLARTHQYDLIHTHEEAGIVGVWISRQVGGPHLYDMHSSLPQQFENFGRFNWWPVVAAFQRIEHYVLAGADGVIAICPELRDHVLASGYSGPVAMIENTLDFDLPAFTAHDVLALRQRLGLGEEQTVLYTGTLEEYQGLDLLVAAAAELSRSPAGRVPRFVLVGGTDALAAPLIEQARRLGVGAQFTFVPAVPPSEVFLYHQLADVLVTTRSRGTNTPLKLYQYLRAGRPIVATAIRSHTQVLDQACAELVAPTPAAIAAGIRRVLDDPARQKALAEGARRISRERYDEAIYLERLRQLLTRLSVIRQPVAHAPIGDLLSRLSPRRRPVTRAP